MAFVLQSQSAAAALSPLPAPAPPRTWWPQAKRDLHFESCEKQLCTALTWQRAQAAPSPESAFAGINAQCRYLWQALSATQRDRLFGKSVILDGHSDNAMGHAAIARNWSLVAFLVREEAPFPFPTRASMGGGHAGLIDAIVEDKRWDVLDLVKHRCALFGHKDQNGIFADLQYKVRASHRQTEADAIDTTPGDRAIAQQLNRLFRRWLDTNNVEGLLRLFPPVRVIALFVGRGELALAEQLVARQAQGLFLSAADGADAEATQ